MSGLGQVSIGVLAAALLGVAPAGAQTQDAHAGHHPADAPAVAAAPPPPAAAPAGNPGGMQGGEGMMGGQGMQMQGKPMQGQMQGGDMSMCGMRMGDSMNMSAHIGERIGAIRSELKITQAQARSWDAFANALRSIATNMDRMHADMMAGRTGATHLSPVERLDRHDRMFATARTNLRTLRPALANLYASLSAEQKQKADTLLVPQGGMMQQMPMGGMMRN
jgi:BMFP domain-containing protein YqiC